MKNYVTLGIIALTMLLLAVPVMALDTASVSVSGIIDQKLSITSTGGNVNFASFTVGDNIKENAVTLTVDAQMTKWQVVTSTSPNNDGWMYLNGTGTYLSSPLERDGGAGWVNVKTFAPTGPITGTETTYPFVERFNQPVSITDKPGSYSTIITYTVSAL